MPHNIKNLQAKVQHQSPCLQKQDIRLFDQIGINQANFMLPPQALAHNLWKQDGMLSAFGFADDQSKITPDISFCPLSASASQMPPQNFQRRRFYSSINDLHQVSGNDKECLEKLSSSNMSTNFTNMSDLEKGQQELRKDKQKMRESQVLDKISKIWTEMKAMKQEIHAAYDTEEQKTTPSPQKVALVAPASEPMAQSVSISAQLGLNDTVSGGQLFKIHQENQKSNALSQIQAGLCQQLNAKIKGDDRLDAFVALIGDQFKADGVVLNPPAPVTTSMTQKPVEPSIPSLMLEQQYSSDFITFTNLQKEIDEQCLRLVPNMSEDLMGSPSPVYHHN